MNTFGGIFTYGEKLEGEIDGAIIYSYVLITSAVLGLKIGTCYEQAVYYFNDKTISFENYHSADKSVNNCIPLNEEKSITVSI